MLEDLFKEMQKDKEQEANFLKECLNADQPFRTSRDYLEKRLSGVDEVIRNNSHELYYNRKFHLQNLYEDKEKIDQKHLKVILGLTLDKNESDYHMKQLKKICIEHKINNPIIGEE